MNSSTKILSMEQDNDLDRSEILGEPRLVFKMIKDKNGDCLYFIENLLDPLGQGRFGTVIKAYDMRRQNKVLAAKQLFIQNVESDLHHFDMELNALKSVKGNHFVKFHDVKKTTQYYYIFMEYFPGKNLQELKNLKIEEILSMIKQIACAFLTQDSVIMHRDLKPANILYENGLFVIADLGFMKFIQNNNMMNHSSCGTERYKSPQQKKGKYSNKCDVWAVGIIALEYALGTASVGNVDTLKFPEGFDEKFKSLLVGMLKTDEVERLSWEEIYNHEALKDLEIPYDDYKLKLQRDKKLRM